MLAEFAIIVLGVTIALWADGWVSARADRAEERARLDGLSDNVATTLTELRDERELATGAVDAVGRLLNDLPVYEEPATQLEDVRYILTYNPVLALELNVYDDLKHSGELALLSSSSLRRELASMDSRLERVRGAQEDLLTVQQLHVDSYMIQHLDLGELALLESVPADPSAVDTGFIADREFRNRVLLKLDLITQFLDALDEAEASLAVVEQQTARRSGK